MKIKNYILHLYSLLPHSIRMFIGVKKRICGGSCNKITIKAHHCRNVRVNVFGSNNEVLIEEGCVLQNLNISINGNGNVLCLNKNVEFIGGGEISLSNNNTKISINENSKFFWGGHKLETAEDSSEIIIGKDCLISNDVSMKTSDYHGIFDASTGERLNKARSIYIGDKVWLAPFVTVLKGTTIKNDSVVGTHSVVAKAFDEPNVVIAGNPARIVKHNIFWKKELE